MDKTSHSFSRCLTRICTVVFNLLGGELYIVCENFCKMLRLRIRFARMQYSF